MYVTTQAALSGYASERTTDSVRHSGATWRTTIPPTKGMRSVTRSSALIRPERLWGISANPHGTRVLLHYNRRAQDRQGRRYDLCDIAVDVNTVMKEAAKSSAEDTNSDFQVAHHTSAIWTSPGATFRIHPRRSARNQELLHNSRRDKRGLRTSGYFHYRRQRTLPSPRLSFPPQLHQKRGQRHPKHHFLFHHDG